MRERRSQVSLAIEAFQVERSGIHDRAVRREIQSINHLVSRRNGDDQAPRQQQRDYLRRKDSSEIVYQVLYPKERKGDSPMH